MDVLTLLEDINSTSTENMFTALENNTLNSAVNNLSDIVTDSQESKSNNLDVAFYFSIMYAGFGATGNSLVILSILLTRRLQNATNYYLLSLAIVDFLYVMLIATCFLLPPGLSELTMNTIVSVCIAIGKAVLMPAAGVHICLISLGRYFAIKDPISRREITRKKIFLRIGYVWLFTLVLPSLGLVLLFFLEFMHLIPEDTIGEFSAVVIYLYPNMVVTVTIGTVFVSFIMTTRLLRKLVNQQQENELRKQSGLIRNIGGKNNDNDKKTFNYLQSEKKAAKVIWVVSFTFLICVTPGTCIAAIFYFHDTLDIGIGLEYTSFILYNVNPVIDPIVYTMFNQVFRCSFKKLILCRYNELNK